MQSKHAMKNSFKTLSISLTSFWLLVFAFVPILFVLGISFLSPNPDGFFEWPLTLHNYQQLLSPMFAHIFVRSIALSIIVTVVCLILAYPFAFCLSKTTPSLKPILICLLIIPFWTSSIIRTYAIMTLLKARGLMNVALLHLGIIHHPLHILFTQTAAVIGLSYNLLPYMILPIYTNMEKLDQRLIDAAKDLGASNRCIFRKIILPLTTPGIIAGIILVFLPSMTLFFIPDLLGGAKSLLLGNLITTQMLTLHNWPMGAATSMLLTLLMLILLFIHQKSNRQQER